MGAGAQDAGDASACTSGRGSASTTRRCAPSVGRFEGDFFDPVKWRPEYPNPAFDNMRADDAFWAARLVAQFSDEPIRAIVAKARYSDPAATEYIATTLIARRDKVLRPG